MQKRESNKWKENRFNYMKIGERFGLTSLVIFLVAFFVFHCKKSEPTKEMQVTAATYTEANNKGVALLKEKKFEEALAYFKKSAELKPDFALAYYNQGVSYQAMDDYKTAVLAYQKARSLNPNDAKIYFNLALVQSKSGDKQGALENYKKFIEIAPPEKMAKPIEDAKVRIQVLSAQ